eukprot:TRINITY_DN69151_c0_g1_i1.p1 TRINITY_DN69151_c0_g1~~TRINITY_DN69151_c0_g1_i1.p1  ORF type:complete len:169 (-),score=16.22 TRINITY_DN69151_c0_g1_i1:1-477(-)
MLGALEAVSHAEALLLVLGDMDKAGYGVEGLLSDKVPGRRCTYSEHSMAAGPCHVSLAESHRTLLFCEDSGGGATLPSTDHQHFIKLNRISSVVLHSTPPAVWRKSDGARSSPPSTDAAMGARGCWFTLHGPRLCWMRRVARKRASPEGTDVVWSRET